MANFGRTWSFTRPGTEDRTGDQTPESTFTVDGCVFWTESEAVQDFQRNTITSRGILAIPDAEDVQQTDRPTSPDGEKFTFTGLARWSEPQALTGRRFGYRIFHVKGVT